MTDDARRRPRPRRRPSAPPEVPEEKRLRAVRRSFRERMEEGDTYGLLLILIIVVYFEWR